MTHALPCAHAERDAIHTDNRAALDPGNRDAILVIDDDPGLRLLARNAFATADHPVVCAEDGESGLRSAIEQSPALVLCDVMMPGIDGFTVCRELRSRPECRDVPIVMLTVLEDPDSIDQAFAAGASEFVVKPINWPLLSRRVREILDTQRDLRALRAREERYARALGGSDDGLWDWNLRDDTVFYSPRWKQMLGYTDGEVGNRPEEWLNRVHPHERVRVRDEIDAHLAGGAQRLESEFRILTAHDGYHWVLAKARAQRAEDGSATRLTGTLSDISGRKRIEERLEHDALHDDLTGLANRALFLDRLEHALQLAARGQRTGHAVLFMDLDRFKLVNDTLGHIHGDALLVEVSRRLRGIARRGDTLARLGGDEFALLLEGVTDVPAVTRMAERILEALREPIAIAGQEIVTGASIGITFGTADYHRAQDLLRDADAAMYRAKTRGGRDYAIFDHTMHAQAIHALQIESQLRRAIDNHEFTLEYQPIMGLHGGGLRGFEALLRWQHPQRGRLLPASFMSVAQDSRLMVPIGRWVLAEACAQFSRWRTAWPQIESCFVGVNISSQELVQPDFETTVVDALARADLPPRCLRLEITENVLVETRDRSLPVLEALNARGVELAIDNFGSGFSSFGHLHRLPLDAVKIDAEFMRGLDQDPRQRGMVEAVIALAHRLELEVVAEGGEDQAILSQIETLPCECAQGFEVCQPTAPDGIERMLAAGKIIIPSPPKPPGAT